MATFVANCVLPVIEIKANLMTNQCILAPQNHFTNQHLLTLVICLTKMGTLVLVLTCLMLVSEKLLFCKGQVKSCVGVFDSDKRCA
jgi:hypothetical protein